MAVRIVWFSAVVCAAALMGTSGAVTATGRAQAQKSTWDGVYTAEQATRGATVYAESCASCHGGTLQGGDQAPSLAGDDFLRAWNELTIYDLFDRIHTTMPQDQPGLLTPAQNADLIAYMLSANKYPAAATELSHDAAVMKTIRIDATKPGR